MVITNKCEKCEKCIPECPVNAITLKKGDTQARIDKSICIECGYCQTVCPYNAIVNKDA